MSEFLPEPRGPMAYPDRSPVEEVPQQAPAAAFPSPPQPMPVMPAPVTHDAYGVPPVEQTGVAGSWLLATSAALVVGAIAAFTYAAISFAIQREFLMLVVGVGALVGLTVAFVAKRAGVVTGIIAVLITGVAVLAADALMVVFFAAGSIPTGLSRLANVDLATAVSAYFEDPLGYLWLAVALLAAFSTASGMGSKRT